MILTTRNIKKLKKDIEFSNGLSSMCTTKESSQKVKDVGFNVTFENDYAIPDKQNPIPFYYEFTRVLSLSGFAASWLGIWILWMFTLILEFCCIAPKGTTQSQGILQLAANSLTKGGKTGSVTVAYVIIGEK